MQESVTLLMSDAGTRADWLSRAHYDAQCGARWPIALLHRRQGLELPHYAPAGLLLALEGTVLVQRGTLNGALAAGQALLLEESCAGTEVHCGHQGQALWLSLSRLERNRAPRWASQWLAEAPPTAAALGRQALASAGSQELLRLAELPGRLAQLGAELRQAASSTLLPLLELCPGRSRRHREDVLERLQRVKALLDIPHGPVVELDALAQVASYSLSHFQRMFTRVYGVSPIEHQRRSRLARARELIAQQRLTVREVAETVGFESRSTFNRLFRERFGDSAGRVRDARL